MLEPIELEQDLTDRRILHEVTGIRLYRDEFLEEASSGSQEDDSIEATDDTEVPIYNDWALEQRTLSRLLK